MSAPDPCIACPWRTANHGRRHPDGWYTAANRDRLWAGLRRGEQMSCHPTDPDNPVSDAAAAAGYRPAPEHAQRRECVGAIVLQQRELMLVQEAPTIAAYRKDRPRGLTREGIARLVERAIFGGTPIGGPAMPRPDLNGEVGHGPLPWTPR
jgi:hypothetical protein